MLTLRSLVPLTLVVTLGLVACSGGPDQARPGPEPSATDVESDRCVVRLHGRSGTGAEPAVHDDHVELFPTGNDEASGGYQWLYGTDAHHDEAVGGIAAWIEHAGCRDVVVYGFSNGAAMAAALYCRGESFDGLLRGVVVDDPVTDEAVEGCAPAEGVPAALYWTGALTEAEAGVRCDDIGFTCSGELILGIDAYGDHLGVDVQASPHSTHSAFEDPPELLDWLLDGEG